MLRRYALAMLVFALVPLLAACGHPWKTAVEARPNPFIGQRRFAVLPVTYNNLVVGSTPEASYLSEKDGEKWASWQADKGKINEEFTRALIEQAASTSIQVVLASGPQDARFFIRPNVTMIEPGFFTGVGVQRSTEIRMTVRITDPLGFVLDEVLLEKSVQPSDDILSAAISGTVTSSARLKQAAEDLGQIMGLYLRHRVSGDD